MDKQGNSPEELLAFLHRTRGFDFSGYKRSSLERRLQKRMHAVSVDSYDAYVDYLELHADEFPQLFNTILINVTSFFRDPEAWEFLKAEVLPPLLAKSDGGSFRAWSAGCASGQEAYTLAMVLAELVGVENVVKRAKIFATDLDEEALHEARHATYTARDVESLPTGYLEKYFDAIGGRYEFKKELRRCVIFGRHDLIHDAFISRIDLLTCRNAVMYMNAETQAKVLLGLHFALSEGGMLMLGKAEMLLSHANLFAPIDLPRRIFRKIETEDGREARQVRGSRVSEKAAAVAPVQVSVRLREHAFDNGPEAQIVVDVDGTLSLANQKARDTFGISPRDLGRPLQDLEISYRPVELRSVLERTYTEGRPVLVKDVERTRGASESTYYDLQVMPLFDRETTLLGAQISFVDVTQATHLHRELRHANHELEGAYEELQSTSEELETTNEELQSTVEELETTNEELQSTNEELETMNEELQSTNEEMQTVNEELRRRGSELSDANTFLGTILATLEAAVVVLDADFGVRVWNRKAEDMWGLRSDEVVGHHVMGLDIGLPLEGLQGAIRRCLSGEAVPEVVLEATNRRGRSISCAVRLTRIAGDVEGRGLVMVIEEKPARASSPAALS